MYIDIAKEKFKRLKKEYKTRDILVLGIESSCDETSISIVKNGIAIFLTNDKSYENAPKEKPYHTVDPAQTAIPRYVVANTININAVFMRSHNT